ncbi:MAG: peptidoglycan DD-metalloendopeptidase family protein, partial [Bdellovibrionia bacterium]
DTEKLEAPRRKVLANLADHGLKEIEALRADYVDAARLESRIQEEKQQLAYLFHDLKEQESVLELNRHLRIDFLKKKQQERVAQLENYRRLKNAEAQVENLIGQFNARRELERNEETERIASREMMQGIFSRLKGKLPYPVNGGKVVANFGRAFDAQSGLYIFKKGVDIEVGKSEPVRAIAAGKIAYAGELPHYGQVVIVDHGDHFYSLCAHLGKISKKATESVGAGDLLGLTGDLNAPLYFEIRARNVAVNPLQWVFN